MTTVKKLRQELGENFREHEEMKKHTSLGCGGVTDFYFEAKSDEEVIKAVKIAQELGLPYRVIGGGTNVLVSDVGYPGLIIVNRSTRLVLTLEKNQIMADAGVLLTQLIMFAAQSSLSGLEPLFGIPGTVGGAVYGNAGTHGVEIGDYLKRVTLLTSKGEVISHPSKFMEFSYRSSRLKRNVTQTPVVLLVLTFQFLPKRKDEILASLNYYQKWRIKYQPLREKTSGSIFKNPGATSKLERPEESAGWLIETANLKGFRVGDAAVSKLHANWIINRGKATARDVRDLISIIKTKVKEKHGMVLEEEIEYLGRWL